mgnify:CR=1 FL=1
MRHGESEANRQKRVSINLGLSELGREQARKRVQEFESKNIDVIYSSNLKRAFETAEIIARGLSKTVQIEQGFAERDYGTWTGLSNELYKERLKDQFAKFDSLTEDEKLDYRYFPTYENNREMMNRFVPALNKAVLENEGKNILVVAHSSIVRMFLIFSKCVTREQIPIEAIKNTGYVHCVYENGVYELKNAVDVEILNT